MKNLCALSLAISASFFPANALAGAWLQNEGEGQVISGLRLYATYASFDADGNLINGEPFGKADLFSYFEYGLHERLTIGGEVDLATTLNQNPGVDDIQGLDFSYGTLFARAYLYKGDNSVLSLEPGVTIPKKIGNDLVSDGDEPIPEIKLSHGYSFVWREQRHFLDNSIKYRFRDDGDLEDMMKWETTFGLGLTRSYTLLMQVTYEHAFDGVENGKTGNYNLVKPQVSILYDRGFGMTEQLGIYANVYGENTGAGGGVLYSFWVNF